MISRDIILHICRKLKYTLDEIRDIVSESQIREEGAIYVIKFDSSP